MDQQTKDDLLTVLEFDMGKYRANSQTDALLSILNKDAESSGCDADDVAWAARRYVASSMADKCAAQLMDKRDQAARHARLDNWDQFVAVVSQALDDYQELKRYQNRLYELSTH